MQDDPKEERGGEGWWLQFFQLRLSGGRQVLSRQLQSTPYPTPGEGDIPRPGLFPCDTHQSRQKQSRG